MKRVEWWGSMDLREDGGSAGSRRNWSDEESYFGCDLVHEGVEVIHFLQGSLDFGKTRKHGLGH
jgi:hypothetical protein